MVFISAQFTEQNIRRGRHCVFKLHAHLVLVTKYRRGVLAPDAFDRLKGICSKVCEDFQATLVALDGEDDHAHLLVEYPPQIQLSKQVNSLKGVSSRLLRKELPALAARYWKGVLWTPSYFAASCGGAPLNVVKQYVENQLKN